MRTEKEEGMLTAAYLIALISIFGIAPCILMLVAWHYLPVPQAWIATAVILLVDGVLLWFKNPFKMIGIQ